MGSKHSFTKVIVFRFCGGVRSGQRVRSDQSGSEINEARKFWELTRNGSVGHRLEVTGPDGLGGYDHYKVLSKFETDNEIHVTCRRVD